MAYKQKTVSFNATDISAMLTISQTKDGATLLLDDVKVVGEVQVPLLLDYVAEAVAAGVESVILADLGLLRLLKALTICCLTAWEFTLRQR